MKTPDQTTKTEPLIDSPKILWGVCGIGNGHTNRQLPLIEHFARKSRMVIFAYGESHQFYSTRFAGHENVAVERVAVPFYVGNRTGIDFEASAARPENKQDFLSINAKAMAAAEKIIGKPDLVISDYEPICAQYAYAYNSPLVTIDQQSKYLAGEFPDLGDQSCADEIARLRLFFPKAAERIATSFFDVTPKNQPDERVEMVPCVLKDDITSLRRDTSRRTRSILLYLSSQQPFGQSLNEITELCAAQKDTTFHLFAPGKTLETLPATAENVHLYRHGDSSFYSVIQQCSGIVTTAGHTLLSEAMHLEIPVYAIPFALYEQQMNARVIAQNGFGISHTSIDEPHLSEFIEGLPDFTTAIHQDRFALLRGPSQQTIIQHLEQKFLR